MPRQEPDELARQAVFRAITSGMLTRPDTYQCCGRSKNHPDVVRIKGRHYQAIQAHHADYSRPLDVVWVCISCHGHLETCANCPAPMSAHEDLTTGKLGRNRFKPERCRGWTVSVGIGECDGGRAPTRRGPP